MRKITYTLLTAFLLLLCTGCRNPWMEKILGPKKTGGSGTGEELHYPGDDPSDLGDNPSDPGDPGDDPSEPGDEHIVTFNFNYSGAPANETQNVFDSDKIDEPTAPPRSYTATEGLYLNPVPTTYELVGWFKDNNTFANEWDFSTDTVDGDIILYAKWTDPKPINVGGGNLFAGAINHINNNATAGTSYTLLRTNNLGGGPGGSDIMPTISAPVNLTIKGTSGARIIFFGRASSSLFTIDNAAATLTLENITLQGSDDGTTSLVTVTNGTLVMETGSTITGHSSGGVRVNGGIFEMKGGTISNNTAANGGGVSVNDGTFEMKGGTISNNTATDGGGGVYVSGSNGKFTMSSTGIISENYANNGSGGGVFVSSGTFEMNNGTINGNTASQAGGVYVSGTFIMNDGTISRNTVSGVGGGVNVGGGGIFKISGGTVYGTNDNNANTSQGQGAALFVTTDYGYDGTAIYGDSSPIETTPIGGGSGNYRNETINGHN